MTQTQTALISKYGVSRLKIIHHTNSKPLLTDIPPQIVPRMANVIVSNQTDRPMASVSIVHKFGTSRHIDSYSWTSVPEQEKSSSAMRVHYQTYAKPSSEAHDAKYNPGQTAPSASAHGSQWVISWYSTNYKTLYTSYIPQRFVEQMPVLSSEHAKLASKSFKRMVYSPQTPDGSYSEERGTSQSVIVARNAASVISSSLSAETGQKITESFCLQEKDDARLGGVVQFIFRKNGTILLSARSGFIAFPIHKYETS